MALTPEDVVNKRFQPTKFREGYDQDEVDDFLDEVVVELRRLNQENEELRQRLVAGDSRIAELQRGAVQAPPASNNFAQEPAPFIAPAPVPVPVPAAEPQAPTYAAAPPVSAPAEESDNANNLLQLARRLHEEHVREGIEKRDALIAEGHSTAARIVGEAEARQRAQLEVLEKERVQLESRVDELRVFEREYRVNLKGYIESQLRELDTSGGLTAAEPVASAPVAEPEAETAAERPFGEQQNNQQYTPQYTPQYSPTATEPPAFPESPAAPATEQRPAQNFPGGFGGN